MPSLMRMRLSPDWRANNLRNYVCDFPSEKNRGNPAIISLPHLGASTQEAEENCAVMVAEQLRDYLEHGNLFQYREFPQCIDAARVVFPYFDCECQCAQYAGANFHRAGRGRNQYSQHA